MKRIVRLTESDLTRIVRRVIMEEDETQQKMANSFKKKTGFSGVEVGPENGVTYITGGKGGSLELKYSCKTKKDIFSLLINVILPELEIPKSHLSKYK